MNINPTEARVPSGWSGNNLKQNPSEQEKYWYFKDLIKSRKKRWNFHTCSNLIYPGVILRRGITIISKSLLNFSPCNFRRQKTLLIPKDFFTLTSK